MSAGASPAGADFLVVAPPVCPPSEPPSGAFLLAAALAGRGLHAPLLDLSPPFYAGLLAAHGDCQVEHAVAFLRGETGAFDPDRHRSACGTLRHALARRSPAGWRITLMDVVPPAGSMHSPAVLTALSESGAMPFAELWSSSLDPVLDDLHPARVLVSLAYLSQLPAAIDLCRHLVRRGYPVAVGGSLPNSLKATGRGSAILESHLPEVLYGDGSVLLGGSGSGTGMLDRLAWPGTAGPGTGYISPRPVIPFAASTGCWWNRCLFCPDRTQPYSRVSDDALEMLLSTAPPEVLSRGPVVHLLDSAVSPASLSGLMPVIRRFDAAFYGFARPGAEFLADGLLEEMAASGCAMMQYGVETADQALLRAYDKGLEVETVRSVLRRTAAAGIRTYAYFLFGLPGEDGDSTERTISFIEEEEGSIDFLNLSVFNLPARSELASRAAEFGMETFERGFDDGRISLYTPFTVGGRSSRFAARRLIAAARASRPGFRRALARTPGWFRAAHLAMINIRGRRDAVS